MVAIITARLQIARLWTDKSLPRISDWWTEFLDISGRNWLFASTIRPVDNCWISGSQLELGLELLWNNFRAGSTLHSALYFLYLFLGGIMGILYVIFFMGLLYKFGSASSREKV